MKHRSSFLRISFGLIAASVGLLSVLASAASAQVAETETANNQPKPNCEAIDVSGLAQSEFYVVKVAGLLDPVVYKHLINQLDKAETEQAAGFVLWMNSNGSVISEEQYLDLATRLKDTELQTGMWVGNSLGNRGRSPSTVQGGSAELATVVDRFALTEGASIGNMGQQRLPDSYGNRFEAHPELQDRIYDAELAEELKISEGPVRIFSDLKLFLADFENFETVNCLTGENGQQSVRQGVTTTVFSGLPLSSQLFHTAASPEVAYIFFTLGMALLVFEFFTAGVGVAGITGAGFFVLGSYGLSVLPTRLWAIALIVISFILMSVDIQTNLPRLYTVIGLIAFAIGSLFLYNEGVTQSLLTLIAAFICALLFVYNAMPAMVRARFSTPTIGRKWMIGEVGVASTDVTPEGLVKIKNAPWKAITNRATPIQKGEEIRVIGISRLLLEVEPLEGAAKDYRDRN